jgi:hypothetical protein
MNILLIGPSASSKTQFLMEIKTSKNCVYFDATNSTDRILQVLNARCRRSKYPNYILVKVNPQALRFYLVSFARTDVILVKMKPTYTDFIQTLVHELVHHKFPNMQCTENINDMMVGTTEFDTEVAKILNAFSR